jgi:hypothetical protein
LILAQTLVSVMLKHWKAAFSEPSPISVRPKLFTLDVQLYGWTTTSSHYAVPPFIVFLKRYPRSPPQYLLKSGKKNSSAE